MAEMGSAFLYAEAGISSSTIEQAASYIAHWRKKLTDEPKLIISAAGAGQRAADWICGVSAPTAGDATRDHPEPEA